MKINLILLCIALCGAQLLTDTTALSTPKSDNTTSSIAVPASSTAVPDSSTAAPASSTAAPASSTAAPASSTAAPTSSTAAPTSSTAAPPAPTTTSAPSTTPSPTPKPSYTNDFVLKDGNMTCARLQLNISAEIPYDEINNATGKYELIPKTNITMLNTSTCHGSNGTEQIHLLLEGKHKLDIVLNKDKDNKISLDLSLTYSQEHFDNATDPHATHTVEAKDLFQVLSTRSYLCHSAVNVTLHPTEESAGAHNVTASLWDVRYMAYVNKTSDDYNQDLQCEQDTQMADIVPIAVGIALACLVVLVVLAYTFSRRRHTKQRGYQSV